MESVGQFVPAGQSVGEFSRFQSSVGEAIAAFRRGLAERGRRMIDGMFSDGTSEEDEDRALAILLGADKPGTLFLINALTWSRLDDELDEPDLTQIALHLSRVCDARDYRVGAILQRAFWSDPAALRERSDNDLRLAAAAIPLEVRQQVADEVVRTRGSVTESVGSMSLRGLASDVREFRVLIDFIQSTGLHHPPQLAQVSWELFYAERICSQLARGEVRLLFGTLPEMLDAALPAVRRVAHYDMMRRWDREFVAFEEIVKAIGSSRQQSDMRRFMEARRLFVDNFPTAAPAQPNALQQAILAILGALNSVAGGFQDLAAAVHAIAQAIDDLSVPKLFGTSSDAEAVNATNSLLGKDLLSRLPNAHKIELIERLLDGAVEDEEEQAILTILRETKKRSVAEFAQLVAQATWEKLSNSFNGQEYDDLEQLFVF
jgi:hypothetical protein